MAKEKDMRDIKEIERMFREMGIPEPECGKRFSWEPTPAPPESPFRSIALIRLDNCTQDMMEGEDA